MAVKGKVKMPCLTPGCKRKVACKGLCPTCYQQALGKVKRKETTWLELEQLGLAKGVYQQRDDRSPFDRAFNEAKDKK